MFQKVIKINDNQVKYDGNIYTRYPKSGDPSLRNYYRRHVSKKESVFLHRKIYEDAFGKIPDGYCIHHIDENPDNNSLENLACVSAAEHTTIHKMGKKVDAQRRQKQSEAIKASWTKKLSRPTPIPIPN